MATLDLVFEGGGAKGMVFVGALQEVLDQQGHKPGRLLGTSAGAITAALLAAGYSVSEMMAALNEKENGQSVFNAFLGKPPQPSRDQIRSSGIRDVLRNANLTFIPDFIENKLDDQIVDLLAGNESFRHVYAFIESGGWFISTAFTAWLARKLDEGHYQGQPRRFSKMTLAQFHAATGVELSLVASDTTWQRMLILNHNTAPDLPLVQAVRMSMGIPLLWEEIVWQQEWGPYLGRNLAGHRIVDGGMLSNFPISLFLAPDANVVKFMGESASDAVLGLLIDDNAPVPVPQDRGLAEYEGDLMQLKTVQRISRLINTMTSAHDAAAIELFEKHVVRLPAAGYGVIEFNMPDDRRNALVAAGRAAMQAYIAANPDAFTRSRGIDTPPEIDIASRAAQEILRLP